VGRKVVEERKVIRANVIKKCHKKLISFCCPAFHSTRSVWISDFPENWEHDNPKKTPTKNGENLS
jgi:hypothetical protein